MTRALLVLFILGVFCLTIPTNALAENTRVFTNITTSDVNRAAMAIKFTHNIMKQKGLEATLFFNVYGVALVDKTKPSPIYPTGESIADLLQKFMDDGGIVIGCPMCMKNVGGMSNDDLLPGVQASPGLGLEAATSPDTLVLSY